jgi:hypothetical protein
MSLNINELEAAVGKMTPGPWANTADGIVQVTHITRDVWYIPRVDGDLPGIVALVNAAPELIKAARERDELAALLRRLRENHPDCNDLYMGVRQMKNGNDTRILWAYVDAALAKVGGA